MPHSVLECFTKDKSPKSRVSLEACRARIKGSSAFGRVSQYMGPFSNVPRLQTIPDLMPLDFLIVAHHHICELGDIFPHQGLATRVLPQ